jgi:hypothetical protein
MDVDWGLVVKLALPAKVTRRINKVTAGFIMYFKSGFKFKTTFN